MRSAKQLIPLICLILVLAGAIAALNYYPQIMDALEQVPWLQLPQPQPDDPEQPVDPENPDNPEQPVDPENPDDPEQPVDPENPDNPEQPVDPENPDNPEQPVDPEKPDDPEQPVDPEKPDDPKPPEQPAPIVSLSGQYYTYDEMVEDMAALAERYPDYMTYRSYGSSMDGRDLLAATLGNSSAPRQIIISGGMHAREYVNPYVIMCQLEYYLRGYQTLEYQGRALSELLEKVALIIVPMTNPDGLTLAQEGLSAIRDADLRDKITAICQAKGYVTQEAIDAYLNKYWKANAAGVDLNRNFDAWWATYVGGVDAPADKNYKGDRPTSEWESLALVMLTKSLTNPVATLSIHSQGRCIYWKTPLTGSVATQNGGLAQLAQTVTGYRIDGENQTEPSFSNWAALQGIPGITVETGLYGYPQSHAAMAGEIFAETRDLWAAIALAYADDRVPGAVG